MADTNKQVQLYNYLGEKIDPLGSSSGSSSGGTLSNVAQALMNNILRKNAYVTKQKINIDGLIEELQNDSVEERYAIIYNLDESITSNKVHYVAKGSSYETTLEFPDNAHILVFMGDENITESVLTEKTISIPNVTDHVIISDLYITITYNIKGVTLSNNDTVIEKGTPYKSSYTILEDYIVKNISVYSNGADITKYCVDQDVNNIIIDDTDNDITINIQALNQNAYPEDALFAMWDLRNAVIDYESNEYDPLIQDVNNTGNYLRLYKEYEGTSFSPEVNDYGIANDDLTVYSLTNFNGYQTYRDGATFTEPFTICCLWHEINEDTAESYSEYPYKPMYRYIPINYNDSKQYVTNNQDGYVRLVGDFTNYIYTKKWKIGYNYAIFTFDNNGINATMNGEKLKTNVDNPGSYHCDDGYNTPRICSDKLRNYSNKSQSDMFNGRHITAYGLYEKKLNDEEIQQVVNYFNSLTYKKPDDMVSLFNFKNIFTNSNSRMYSDITNDYINFKSGSSNEFGVKDFECSFGNKFGSQDPVAFTLGLLLYWDEGYTDPSVGDYYLLNSPLINKSYDSGFDFYGTAYFSGDSEPQSSKLLFKTTERKSGYNSLIITGNGNDLKLYFNGESVDPINDETKQYIQNAVKWKVESDLLLKYKSVDDKNMYLSSSIVYERMLSPNEVKGVIAYFDSIKNATCEMLTLTANFVLENDTVVDTKDYPIRKNTKLNNNVYNIVEIPTGYKYAQIKSVMSNGVELKNDQTVYYSALMITITDDTTLTIKVTESGS